MAFEMSTIAFHDEVYWQNLRFFDSKNVSGYCFVTLIKMYFVCEYIVLWSCMDYIGFHLWIIMISDQIC